MTNTGSVGLMLEPPRISGLAVAQLAAWEHLAAGWAMYEDWPCLRCASCHISVMRLADDRNRAYTYTDEQRLLQVVAHLRQAHMDLDPDR